MTLFGFFMMIVSNAVVLGLAVYCFYRVFTTKDVLETEHAPLTIDTEDADPPVVG
jgi:hypothetical protein